MNRGGRPPGRRNDRTLRYAARLERELRECGPGSSFALRAALDMESHVFWNVVNHLLSEGLVQRTGFVYHEGPVYEAIQ